MKNILSLLILIPSLTCGQNSFKTATDIEMVLTDFQTQTLLNRYLWTNGFLDKKFHKSQNRDSTIFQLNAFEIDFFKKNIFGTDQNELIVQIRDGKNWSVVVFYEQDGFLLKVPNCLGPNLWWNRHLGSTYLNCLSEPNLFIFEFAAILSQNKFNIISKTREECGSGEYLERTIWNISKDTIYESLTWIENGWSRYYAGDYHVYTIESDFEILDNDSYPKMVRLTTKIVEENFYNYESDTTGTITSRNNVTTYHYKSSENLEYSKVIEEENRTTRYIGRRDE